jgi:hypothetical protein
MTPGHITRGRLLVQLFNGGSLPLFLKGVEDLHEGVVHQFEIEQISRSVR